MNHSLLCTSMEDFTYFTKPLSNGGVARFRNQNYKPRIDKMNQKADTSSKICHLIKQMNPYWKSRIKIILLFVALVSIMLNPAVAQTSSKHRPVEAALLATFKFPVVVDGKPAGSVTASKGTLVKVEHVRQTTLMISLGATSAWVKRSDTDFDGRLVAYKAARQRLASAYAAENAAYQAQAAATAADFEQEHANDENPLDKGTYNYHRSVVDYYDCDGNRYHIGVFGQRIYD